MLFVYVDMCFHLFWFTMCSLPCPYLLSLFSFPPFLVLTGFLLCVIGLLCLCLLRPAAYSVCVYLGSLPALSVLLSDRLVSCAHSVHVVLVCFDRCCVKVSACLCFPLFALPACLCFPPFALPACLFCGPLEFFHFLFLFILLFL